MTAPIVIGLALRDDDAAPLTLGRAIARLTGAPLALVSAYVHDPGLPQPVPEIDAPMLKGTMAALEDVAESLRDEHAVEVHATRGSTTHVLHQVSERLGAGLIVVGSSHRGRLGRVLAGSVTAGVLHGSHCALAVAPRGYTGHAAFERIAVAYDGSDESRDALAAAAGLAAFAGGNVHSYTALEPIDRYALEAVPGLRLPDDYEQSRRARAERLTEQARAVVPEGALTEASVIVGRTAEALVAVSHDSDLLVCGSRGHGALRSMALGSVSRVLANEATCPILVMPRASRYGDWKALDGRHHAVGRN
jgi:nucleotide-binding universal stress UspA family protein